MMRDIEEMRSFGRILVYLNATCIALIPKFDNPSTFEEYWWI